MTPATVTPATTVLPPPPSHLARPPLVLGLHPRRGWAEASRGRRLLAAACPVLLALWAVLAPAAGDLVCVTSLLAGPAFCSAARVLRPDPGGSAERLVRHALAGGSTAAGTAFLLLLARGGSAETEGLAGFVATTGLLLTLPWGVAALVVRTARTPVGAAAAR